MFHQQKTNDIIYLQSMKIETTLQVNSSVRRGRQTRMSNGNAKLLEFYQAKMMTTWI